jgi:hypothetical protein
VADKRWIAETLFDRLGIRMSYRVDKVLYETRTRHQHLVLFEQPFLGKTLMLDGATQITARDEFIYQEMMAHVPLFAHGRARDVLIVGGGDCGIAEEVLKHKGVRRLTQVEIDPAVIEFAKRHFPEFTRPVFGDRRFESVIGDGMRYVARTERRFDVIIVDSTDVSAARTGCQRRQISPAVRRRHLFHRCRPDLYRRPHGDGLGERRPAIAPRLGAKAGGAPSARRRLSDQILDAGSPRRRLCAAALHHRPGRQGESAQTRHALHTCALARSPAADVIAAHRLPAFLVGKSLHFTVDEYAL